MNEIYLINDGLEYHLLEDHGIQTCRMTLHEIATSAKLVSRRLIVPKARVQNTMTQEISVVYLRAGYGPSDYPSETEWQGRRLLELSKAIKCPTIITQLAGCKKVQQVLSNSGMLERYLPSRNALIQISDDEEDAREVRKTFTKMYPFDTSEEGLQARQASLCNPRILRPKTPKRRRRK